MIVSNKHVRFCKDQCHIKQDILDQKKNYCKIEEYVLSLNRERLGILLVV